MSRHDTDPSILDLPIPRTSDENRSIKRTKLFEAAEETGPTSVATRIDAGTYESIGDLITDVETASLTILAQVQLKDGLLNGTRQSLLSAEDRQLVASALALKKLLNSLVLREIIQRPSELSPGLGIEENAEDEHIINGAGDNKLSRSSTDNNRDSRTVLTLYGSAPQPKQLFSSLQEPVHTQSRESKDHSKSTPQSSHILDESDLLSLSKIDVLTPLREIGLPNGISTTQIVPVHSTDFVQDHKRVPTLGDLFAPPSTLAQLNPPRQSKHTATRSSSVNWFNPAEAATTPKSNRRDVNTYSTEPLSTGQWLNYSIAPSPTQLSSPEAKRKQRDRALSIGESKPALPQEVVAAHHQAKEDALFRSAYSSFAPSHDDAAAIVPECTKNRLWWRRARERRLKTLLIPDSASETVHDDPQINGSARSEDADEDKIFKEAVESWTPEELPLELMDVVGNETQRNTHDKDVNEILKEVSELLETLHSYQRIRNLSLASNARSTVGQNSQLTAMSGSPTSPSSAEFDVYSMLKSQLSLMISILPPYAVAKLDGQQLENLSISTRIIVEGKEYRGTMEEDEFTAKARQAAFSSAAGTSARTQTPNTTHGSRSGHYQPQASMSAQYAQRGAYPAQASGSRQSQTSGPYHTQQQYAARPTSSSNHYPGASTTQTYSSQRPTSATSPHPPYSEQQYGQLTPQSSQQNQYGQNGHRQYFQQGTTQNGHTYHQNYSSQHQTTPQAPMQSQQYQQRPSQPGYQQRAQDSSAYNASVAAARSASPQKTQAYTPQQPRQSYSTPSQGQSQGHQRQQYFQQQSQTPQYASNLSNPTSANGSVVGASGFHTHLSAEQQAIMMSRQKAQLAQQNQAGINTNRQGSGTPQPAPNGQYAGQRNGKHVAQQSGTLVTTGTGQ